MRDAALFSKRTTAAFLWAYGLVMIGCLGLRPLWLDEVQQLVGTRLPSVTDLIRWVPSNIGASPLGYLVQRPIALAAGPSAFWARLPSVFFSLAACWTFLSFCRLLAISARARLFALVIFALVPLQLRYAIEGRVYSQALWLSLLSAVALFRLVREPSPFHIGVFTAASMGAIYTQPYSIAPTFGMVAWESWKSLRDARWKVPVSATICCAFAAGAYLPWYLYSWPTWRHGEEVSGIPKFHWSAGLAQDIFKGFSGGDFLCSALLLGAAVAGARSATVPIATRTSLVFTALFVFSTVLLVDAWKGYFFAARQFLFAVPVVAVLAGLGLQRCFESKRAAGLTLAILLLGACLRSDGAIALNNREDWAAAARALEMTSKEGYCLKFVAEELGGVTLYAVFAPGLRSSLCRGPLQAEPKVALVWHTYLRPSQITRNQGALWAAGFVPADILRVGGTTIQRAILQQRP